MKTHCSDKARYSYIALTQISLLFVSFSAMTVLGWIYGIQPWLNEFHQTEVHPTGIPWLHSQAECEQTGRVWQEDTCWDANHDPAF